MNYAHRIDVLHDLMEDKALTSLAEDEAGYWEPVGNARYDRYAETVHALFLKQGRVGSGTQGFEEIATATGVLNPGDGDRVEVWAPDGARAAPGRDLVRADDAASIMAPSDVYSLQAEPGYLYGFYLETADMPMRADANNPFADRTKITVKPASAAHAPKSVGKYAELDLEATAWASVDVPTTLEIEILGQLKRPSNYTLHAYRWKLPVSGQMSGDL